MVQVCDQCQITVRMQQLRIIDMLRVWIMFCLCWSFTAQSTTTSCRAGKIMWCWTALQRTCYIQSIERKIRGWSKKFCHWNYISKTKTRQFPKTKASQKACYLSCRCRKLFLYIHNLLRNRYTLTIQTQLADAGAVMPREAMSIIASRCL